MRQATVRDGRVAMRLAASAVPLAVFVLLLCVGAAGATGHPRVTRVSRCPGRNAEVVQAVQGRFVYEAWIGCGGIGFARSLNGGKTFKRSITVRGSAGRSWDPAIAVAGDGTIYASYMMFSVVQSSAGQVGEMRPAVAVSHNHGHSFGSVSRLPVPTPQTKRGNWGDREFIAVGADDVVYVTWDYGPRADQVKEVCLRGGSCAYAAGDFNAVIQKSSDGGATWTMPASISPGFPLGGVYSAPIVAQPDGALDVLYWQHPTNPSTLSVSRGHEYFTRSTDGGTTWSPPVPVGSQAGTTRLDVWWVDGALGADPAGNLYAAWDTQRGHRDTAWLAWSTDGGAHWSPPLRVASSRSEHLVEVAPAGRRNVYVGWQTPVRRKGYATFVRRLSVGSGWTGRAKRVSRRYGNAKVWPGDTFGLSTRRGAAIVSWGSATHRGRTAEIYASRVALRSHRSQAK
jgi:hypothetical protein